MSALLLLLGIAGCGAKVIIVDDDGEGGASSTGSPSSASTASAASTASSASTATATASSTSSGFITACQRLCMDFAQCLGGDADCFDNCQALYVPGCTHETDEYVLCLAHNFGPSCELGSQCDGELAVYDNCVLPTIDCQESVCSEEPGASCECSGSCEATSLIQSCYLIDDFYQCDCVADGERIGFCQQRTLDCELDQGCCKPLWLLTQG